VSEHITVILVTYGHRPERTEYAVRTISAVSRHLRYPNWSWYISDDGSQSDHLGPITEAVRRSEQPVVGGHNEHVSYGAGANKGLRTAFQHGELVLMLEDDWELSEDLDIWKYAALLMERPDIGMVRMGYLNAGLSATVFGHKGSLYWALDDSQSRNYSSFAFAGHPSIIHKRLFDHVGLYPERVQPGDTELGMCWKVAANYGPKIVWPASMGERGPWSAIGTVQSYDWDGGSGAEYK
jgi:hypothetical protein